MQRDSREDNGRSKVVDGVEIDYMFISTFRRLSNSEE